MPFIETGLPDLLIYEPRVFPDNRGYFFESYNKKEFLNSGYDYNWVQDNQSRSEYGVIRGLHYQHHPFAQAKLVRVLSGKIWDVAVDIRKGSPTYGKVYALELSDENKRQLLIPRGFAHGFSVLSEMAEVMYKCDNYYDKASEGSIIWNDAFLNIDWKIISGKEIISEKDQLHPQWNDAVHDFKFR